MNKSTLNKMRANLDKALEPPRPITPPKDDNSESIARRYAVPEASQSARGADSTPPLESVPLVESVPPPESTPPLKSAPGTESRNYPVQNVPGVESVPPPESVPHKGHLRLTNQFIYDIMPRLKPSDGYMLLYLIARTHGFRQTQVTVTLDALARACCVSRSQARVNVKSLIQKGYVRHLGTDSSNRNPLLRGLILEVVEPAFRGTESTPRAESTPRTESTPIKDIERIKVTRSQKSSVGVSSRYTLEQCRKYAEHLRSSGEGITNPGGYATAIHRTGEADALIEAFLEPQELPGVINTSNCPDCQGTGFWYPEGVEKGVSKCKHERLTNTP